MKLFFYLLSFFLFLPFRIFSQNPVNFIYDKERLVILKDSMTVYGIIKHIKGEVDGDYHLRLKLVDSRQEDTLLVERNYTKQDGCLVLEIICAKNSVFSICSGYENQIPLPKVGDFVKVLGNYVFDKRHGWMEIHPIFNMTKIEVFDF